MSRNFTIVPQEITQSPEWAIANAAQSNRIDIIEKWLDGGADVNKVVDVLDKQTILHRAAIMAQSKVIELALKRGADPNMKAKNGYTALHYACIMYLSMLKDSNRSTLVEMMMLNPNAVADMDAKKSIDLLIAAGADVNAINDKGQKPFDLGPTYLPSFQDTMSGGGGATKAAGRSPE